MRKLATTAAATALALTSLAGASAVSHAADAPARHATTAARTQHVMRLLIHGLDSQQVGDHRNVGVDRLRSFKTRKVVGYDNFASVFNPKTDHLRFWLSISLDGGLIDSVFSTHVPTTHLTGPITHGSGKFRGIRGTIEVKFRPKAPNVYVLRYTL